MLKNTRRTAQAVERDIIHAERKLRKELFWFNMIDRFGTVLSDQHATMARQARIVAECTRQVSELNEELGMLGVAL